MALGDAKDVLGLPIEGPDVTDITLALEALYLDEVEARGLPITDKFPFHTLDGVFTALLAIKVKTDQILNTIEDVLTR